MLGYGQMHRARRARRDWALLTFTAAMESTDTLQDHVAALVEGILRDGPCFAVEIAVRGKVGSQAVDVFVESDAALDAYALGQISREVGYVLDTDEVMPGPYTLNVSSPGADRPLRLPRQYRKMIGRRLRVHYRQASGTCTEVVGALEYADAERIAVAARNEPVTISYDNILWAKVQLPW